uniref:SH2 domain-containing protein n=1 Tax=Anser brachyrhynchus TaxID=132585 RepID=A0A8B9C882_9AVES
MVSGVGCWTLLALCREGSFLVRDCETSPEDYSLSTRAPWGGCFGTGLCAWCGFRACIPALGVCMRVTPRLRRGRAPCASVSPHAPTGAATASCT